MVVAVPDFDQPGAPEAGHGAAEAAHGGAAGDRGAGVGGGDHPQRVADATGLALPEHGTAPIRFGVPGCQVVEDEPLDDTRAATHQPTLSVYQPRPPRAELINA